MSKEDSVEARRLQRLIALANAQLPGQLRDCAVAAFKDRMVLKVAVERALSVLRTQADWHVALTDAHMHLQLGMLRITPDFPWGEVPPLDHPPDPLREGEL
jgi:hypothetical protein